MKPLNTPEVADVFNLYPEPIRQKLLQLRQLVFATAAETDEVISIEETLKWGEPSYLTAGGSTIRMDWKKTKPEQYAMYFHCRTKLIDTFRELYGSQLTFEGNRAIVFHQNDHIPVLELKVCIKLALTYQRRKHLPLLGV